MRLIAPAALVTASALVAAFPAVASGERSATDKPRSAAAKPSMTKLAPGVRLERHKFGGADANDRWAVHVYLPGTLSGPLDEADTALGSRKIADRVATALREEGFTPRLAAVRTPNFSDYKDRRIGWTVRAGTFVTEADAQERLDAISEAGFNGGLRFTAQDGNDDKAPQRVYVVRVNFKKFRGTVGTGHGKTVFEKEKLTTLLDQSGAIAGTNAQWFYESGSGGLYVKNGKVLGTATRGRGGVKITKGGRKLDVGSYTSKVVLETRRDRAVLDAVNRVPGIIWNCGGIGGDQPTQQAQHDLRCTDDSELVRFTSRWGETPAGDGAEAVVNGKGKVVAVNDSRGAAVPRGGSTVQATGARATWLQRHLQVGEKVEIKQTVRNGKGRRVKLRKGLTILQVGPTLVRNGKIDVNARADGLIRQGSDKTFTYNWGCGATRAR
ncbi:SPOR domain-containing protein [Nocardioidaceae bacterium SCSIO 66511]|nr:SPOR domain-containing protein [Nocardioidaceae bacterium SCSIO 66511]